MPGLNNVAVQGDLSAGLKHDADRPSLRVTFSSSFCAAFDRSGPSGPSPCSSACTRLSRASTSQLGCSARVPGEVRRDSALLLSSKVCVNRPGIQWDSEQPIAFEEQLSRCLAFCNEEPLIHALSKSLAMVILTG